MPKGIYPRKKKFPAMSMKQLETFKMASKPYEYRRPGMFMLSARETINLISVLLGHLKEELGGSE